MKFTNNHNMPQFWVDAVEGIRAAYTSGGADISATRLISPARQVALQKQYAGKTQEDVADMAHSVLGTAIHAILEKAGETPTRTVERRLFAEMDGWTISGQYDVLENGVLYDTKSTSVWEIRNGVKKERIEQLNILSWLCRKNGVKVDRLAVFYILKDRNKQEAKRDRDYPQLDTHVVTVPQWSLEEQEKFIKIKISEHQEAQLGNLPECTSEETWETPTKYALMKKGRKSAIRLLDSEQEAWEYGMENGCENNENNDLKPEFYIEARPGERKRCQQYCSVSEYCEQWREFNGQ